MTDGAWTLTFDPKKYVNEYDQEILKSQTADQVTALRERVKEH